MLKSDIATFIANSLWFIAKYFLLTFLQYCWLTNENSDKNHNYNKKKSKYRSPYGQCKWQVTMRCKQNQMLLLQY